MTLYKEAGFAPGWVIEAIDIKSSSIIDPYTLNITLRYPYSPFIYCVASQWGDLIVSPSFCKAHATPEDPWAHEYLKEHMCGTGPYVLDEWVREDHVTMVKNPNYWGGWKGPHVDKIFMPIIMESAPARLRLEEGTLDMAALNLEDAMAVKGKQGIVVKTVPGLTDYMIFMNTQKPPLNNKLIRYAISYLYDYAGTIATVRHDMGTQARGPIPRSLWGWDPDCPQFTMNLTKAEELIRQAGYKPEDIKLDYWFEGDEPRRIAEILQAGAAQIGVKITLHSTTWATLIQVVRPGSDNATDAHDLAGVYWWPDYADPIAFFDPMYRCYNDTIPTKISAYPFYNWGFYSNATLNHILDEFVRETNHTKRIELSHQAQRIIAQDAPCVFVFDSLNTLCYRDWVKGYYFNPLYTGTTDFYSIYIEGR